MGKNNTRILITTLAMVLTTAMMIDQAKSVPLCKVDTNDLQTCRPAVTGYNPPLPSPACCAVTKAANIECLCPYLSRTGVDSSKIKALVANCGVNPPLLFAMIEELVSWNGHRLGRPAAYFGSFWR